jgi:CheY-like chemotaxis protein
MPTLIILDDMPDIRQAIRNTLNPPLSQQERMAALIAGGTPLARNVKYAVIEAAQGLDAVEIVARDPLGIDLVIADMRMPPGIDGKETIQRMRAAGYTGPVIVCSAYADHSDDELRAANGGPLRILQKPYRSTDLLAAVDQALREGR